MRPTTLARLAPTIQGSVYVASGLWPIIHLRSCLRESMKLGKHWVARIAPSNDPDAWVPIVNEISRGSRCKYRLDK